MAIVINKLIYARDNHYFYSLKEWPTEEDRRELTLWAINHNLADFIVIGQDSEWYTDDGSGDVYAEEYWQSIPTLEFYDCPTCIVTQLVLKYS